MRTHSWKFIIGSIVGIILLTWHITHVIDWALTDTSLAVQTRHDRLAMYMLLVTFLGFVYGGVLAWDSRRAGCPKRRNQH